MMASSSSHDDDDDFLSNYLTPAAHQQQRRRKKNNFQNFLEQEQSEDVEEEEDFGTLVPRRPNPEVKKKTKATNLSDAFTMDPELAKIMFLVKELPIFSKSIKIQKNEKRILNEIMESLLWKVYSSRKARTRDNNFKISISEWCKQAERSISLKSENEMRKQTGQNRLSLAIACDCLGRMGKTSPFLRLLYNEIVPSVFKDFVNGKSVYTATPWPVAAAAGDGVNPEKPFILRKIFESVNQKSKAMFICQLLKMTKDNKHMSDVEVEQVDNGTSFFVDEQKKFEQDMKEELAWRFSFRDDTMQLALQYLNNVPPTDFLEMIFRTFELDEINDGLENYTILPRLANILERKSLLKLQKRRNPPAGSTTTAKKDAEKQNNNKKKNQKKDQLDSFEVLDAAVDDDKLRHRLIRRLILMEINEGCLADILILLLDQITHAECSDELYQHVLTSDTVAVRVFTRKLEQRIAKKQAYLGNLNVQEDIIEEKDEDAQSSDEEELVDIKNKSAKAIIPSHEKMEKEKAKEEEMKKIPTSLETPKGWKKLLPDKVIDTIPPKLNVKESHQVVCLILELYYLKIENDKKIGNDTPVLQFERDCDFSNFVLEKMIEKGKTRPVAQKLLKQFVDQLEPMVDMGNKWVIMFSRFAGLIKDPIVINHDKILHCVLLAFSMHSSNLFLEGKAPLRMPSVDIKNCMDTVEFLFRELRLVEKDKAEQYLVQIRERLHTSQIPLEDFLGFVYDSARVQQIELEKNLHKVFDEIVGGENCYFGFKSSKLKHFLQSGLKISKLRARFSDLSEQNDEYIEKIFNKVIQECTTFTFENYLTALTFYSETPAETVIYKAFIRNVKKEQKKSLLLT